ncbi:MAG TPA: EcsC family protein [Ohtaekwangia sp.]|nr:EcsC family protein [Ohtaekwangia sp.]
MDKYETIVYAELAVWQEKMAKAPGVFDGMSKRIQTRINRVIPEKAHAAITAAIKQMTRAVIFGSEISTTAKTPGLSLQVREHLVKERIKFYRNTAATEGALTGAAGFFVGLADFPLWLTLKMKLLFEIASLYGVDTKDYKERIYMLHIFQLTFSSQQHRNKVYGIIENWESERDKLPPDINGFDWRSFQQEYRDYIDLAKLLQLIPGIGAVVGAYVNHRLTVKLGETAINAYRMRWKNSVIKKPDRLL